MINYRDFLDGNLNKIDNIFLEYRGMYILVFADNKGNIDLQVYNRNQRMNQYEHIIIKIIDEKYDVLEVDLKEDGIDNIGSKYADFRGILLSEEIVEEAKNSFTTELKNNEDFMSKTRIISQQKEEISSLNGELYNHPKMLSTYDHRLLLFEAISKVIRQLIIVLPWIRKNTEDYEFIRYIEGALNRNVIVIIRYIKQRYLGERICIL